MLFGNGSRNTFSYLSFLTSKAGYYTRINTILVFVYNSNLVKYTKLLNETISHPKSLSPRLCWKRRFCSIT